MLRITGQTDRDTERQTDRHTDVYVYIKDLHIGEGSLTLTCMRDGKSAVSCPAEQYCKTPLTQVSRKPAIWRRVYNGELSGWPG